jgi:SAM-dependent methyltransferase
VSPSARRELARRVADRYRACGRFARHYVAGKLRWDPVFAALLEESVHAPFGRVADLGCGRGQFAAALLQEGLAESVIGLEINPVLLANARRAMATLPFEGICRDLAADPPDIPAVDTVLILDVLYQLPTDAQARLLEAAGRRTRRLMVIRTMDPDLGVRTMATNLLEHAGRRFRPHARAGVNARPVNWISDLLKRAGFAVEIAPCRAGTPFSNVLLLARKAPRL